MKRFFRFLMDRNHVFATVFPALAIMIGAFFVQDFRPDLDRHFRINVPTDEFQEKYNILSVPTYDGNNQSTHPKVLYFPKGWNGYKYWMSMTPYPYARELNENPSVVVSNDGEQWVVPEGLINPVSGIPEDAKQGGHYSDSHIVMKDGVMELWYRYNRAWTREERRDHPRQRTNNRESVYYRTVSSDGITWSKPELMLEGGDGLLSVVINYEDGKYKLWYATYDGNLIYMDSPDTRQWSEHVHCEVPVEDGERLWHQDILRYKGTYYSIQTVYRHADRVFYNYLYRSEDGIRFEKIKKLLPTEDEELWADIQFYRSTLYEKDGELQSIISIIIPKSKYYLVPKKIDL